MEGDELIRDYLGRLEAAARPLPSERRAELGDEVREHIEAALDEAGRRDPVTVRNVLERLGRPEEIVAGEADADSGPPSPSQGGPLGGPPGPAAFTSGWGAVEVAAILLLTVGGFLLPLFGPALGLALVWLSTRWTTREKAIATIIVIVIWVLPIVGLFSIGGQAGTAG